MDVFHNPDFADHEQVVFVSDAEAGLRGIIAIHSTRLGPALGGCRMFPYASEADAVRDVLRLSRGMTFKAAAAGLDLGGGKAVIIGDPKQQKTPALLRAMGQAVERLGGRYITAEDVGTTVADMAELRAGTRYVVGLGTDLGGSGDPSPTTARGCYEGIVAAVEHKWGSPDLAGRHVVVQGLGNVGWHLCDLLTMAGARLTVADIDEMLVLRAEQAFSARRANPINVHSVLCDVFSPCAMGAGLTKDTVSKLGAPIVAGAANNQLAEESVADLLRSSGVLYAPDFVVNAAGLIRVAAERTNFDETAVARDVAAIRTTLLSIFQLAEAEGISTHEAALRLASARLAEHRPIAVDVAA